MGPGRKPRRPVFSKRGSFYNRSPVSPSYLVGKVNLSKKNMPYIDDKGICISFSKQIITEQKSRSAFPFKSLVCFQTASKKSGTLGGAIAIAPMPMLEGGLSKRNEQTVNTHHANKSV